MSRNERQEQNRMILELLKDYIEKYPTIRFGQALQNLFIVETELTTEGFVVVKDCYYDEPEDMLKRMTQE